MERLAEEVAPRSQARPNLGYELRVLEVVREIGEREAFSKHPQNQDA
jgi:hypothetical protein